MAARKQKKIWRYVDEGSVLKVKSYLQKHRGLELNFCQGKRKRGLLHLACSDLNHKLLKLLLKHGADPLLSDRNGDTPLHLAARKALKFGKPAAEARQCSDLEQEWMEKLRRECQDEFFETFGQYEEDVLTDDDDEQYFDDWAEKVRIEYQVKLNARRRADRKQRQKKEEEEESERRELHARLEKEHREYLERASRNKEETQQKKKRRYEERCDAVFCNSFSGGALGYDDIPWPAPCGSVDKMIAVILHGVDQSDTATFRRFLRRQQALWHPDKFAQRCGGRLKDQDRQRILDTVTALSQALNSLAQSLR